MFCNTITDTHWNNNDNGKYDDIASVVKDQMLYAEMLDGWMQHKYTKIVDNSDMLHRELCK